MSTVLLWAAIAALGGAGAVARVALERAVPVWGGGVPTGRFQVNLLGALALGALDGAALGGDGRLLLAGGLLGSFTTFSGWMAEADGLRRAGRPRALALDLGLSLAAGLALFAAGRALGGLL
ncbi:MAG: CrcB family protein [Solirubrobacteraceae bacterium]|jgi:CrcB protein|nr:CrcB family protein [Solirubrobacteraceae bacterium]MCU0313735.1 CrcB family protein [Solirubrobacteraceae bacterium]